jgi:hypothetical protein
MRASSREGFRARREALARPSPSSTCPWPWRRVRRPDVLGQVRRAVRRPDARAAAAAREATIREATGLCTSHCPRMHARPCPLTRRSVETNKLGSISDSEHHPPRETNTGCARPCMCLAIGMPPRDVSTAPELVSTEQQQQCPRACLHCVTGCICMNLNI